MEYSQEILDALDSCIEGKWASIVEGSGIDKLDENCELCQVCSQLSCGNKCTVCPFNCDFGSKYRDWEQFFKKNVIYSGPRRVIDAESRELAVAVLEDLKRVREKLRKVEEKFYKKGDRFKLGYESTYMIAHIGDGKCLLINERNGNFYAEKIVQIPSSERISEKNLRKMGATPESFVKSR